jgi:5-methyltetrahydropteroyltriglutamate--homocysteine methyltransferase
MATSIRAETVGSLLRPDALKAMVAQERGSRDEDKLREVADKAVIDAIRLQESVGLDVINDGEQRRRGWILTQECFSGFRPMPVAEGLPWKGPQGRRAAVTTSPAVVEPIKVIHDLHQQEYAFLKEHAHAPTKITVVAPSFHRYYWWEQHSHSAYDRVEDFLIDVRDKLRAIVEDLVEMGCEYVQLDQPMYSNLGDPECQAFFELQGSGFGKDLGFDTDLDNSVVEGLQGVTTGIHLCRGNGAGYWVGDTGYEPMAAELFPRLRFDRFLLEYDSPRAGSFEPLVHVPKDSVVVLGLVTTKSGELEDADAIKRRIGDAQKFVPLERLALSPQCGFASGAAGNPITYEQQEAKLQLVTRVAREVWADN